MLALHGGTPIRPSLRRANPRISDAAKQKVLDVLAEGTLNRFYGGAQVRGFELAYAERFGRRYGQAMNSGTSALHIAYLAAEIEEFSEVLVPANAYVSAVSALIQCNLVPVFVDIDPQSWVMDPSDVLRKLTPRTRAIVPVHMYGQPCPMITLTEIAARHSLVMIEDCGQSHGALWDNQLLGTFGEAACFSLCCLKHVSAGEGGIVTTDSEALYDRARALVHKGKGEGWFDYRYMGFSYGMTEVQGVLALHSLHGFDEELGHRQRLAKHLQDELSDLPLDFPLIPAGATHAYFKCNVLLPEELAPFRNEIVDAIRAENIGADPAHPYLLEIDWLREQKPSLFRLMGGSMPQPDYDIDSCPVAKALMARQICLEVASGLDIEDMDHTIAAVRKVLAWYAAGR